LSTVVSETPSLAASRRVLQWIAPSGFVCVVTRTISAALNRGFHPLRGKSDRIALPCPRQIDRAMQSPGLD